MAQELRGKENSKEVKKWEEKPPFLLKKVTVEKSNWKSIDVSLDLYHTKIGTFLYLS